MPKGKFIVIEGSDGSGKTTQIQLLREFLEKRGDSAEIIDFPDYKSFYGKMILNYLSGEYGDPTNLHPQLSSVLYALDRLAKREYIQDLISKGVYLLANRYVYSNQAYQAAKLDEKLWEDFFAWENQLEFKENKLPREDCVVFLYLPFSAAANLTALRERRPTGRKRDLHEENLEYRKRVEEVYLYLAKKYDWMVIHCMEGDSILSIGEIHEKLVDRLKNAALI